jgi:hypothetical protein
VNWRRRQLSARPGDMGEEKSECKTLKSQKQKKGDGRWEGSDCAEPDSPRTRSRGAAKVTESEQGVENENFRTGAQIQQKNEWRIEERARM